MQYSDYMGQKFGMMSLVLSMKVIRIAGPLSGTVMMLTLKLGAFGFDYGDEKLRQQAAKSGKTNGNAATEEVQFCCKIFFAHIFCQLKTMKFPSVLAFLGYVFF